MAAVTDVLPDLRKWNAGAGISPEDWIYIEGRADHALGFCSLFWPEFAEVDEYILRAPVDVERLRSWERAGLSRQQVETAMNAVLYDHMFPDDETEPSVKSAQLKRLATIMSDMLMTKLNRDFPDRRFSAIVLEGADFGLSFHQI